MNRRLLIPSLLAGVLTLMAFATTAQAVDPYASTGNQAAIASTADPHLDRNDQRVVDRHCLRETGSRIVARSNTTSVRAARAADASTGKRCVAANGRVYSRDDLDRTGEIDIADALRKLDPAIR